MPDAERTPEHVGEWKVTVSGTTLEDIFVATARLIAHAAGRSADEQLSEWEPIEVTARDIATLLADWANELIGRTEISGRAYTELRAVEVSQRERGWARVTAQLRGKRVEQWTSPLKAATYHALSLEKGGGGWRAQVLFDV
jgi:SHS2 domain-containing protein